MSPRRLVPVLALALPLYGCSSEEPARCDTSGGRPLAGSAWPKSRADSANTGRVEADLTGKIGVLASELPPGAEAFEPIATSPIISADRILLVARERREGAPLRLYQFDPQSGADEGGFDLSFPTSATASIRSTPLLSGGSIVIPLDSGLLHRYDLASGELLRTHSIGPLLSGSPAIDNEGTIFVNNTAGVFSALCNNGIPRFSRLTSGSQSAIALFEGENARSVADDMSIVAGDDGRLRAFNIEGRQLWLFSAAAAIIASPVVDAARRRVYTADTTGRVFAVRLSDGRRCRDFEFDAGARVTASPALGRTRDSGAPGALFVAAEDGLLYALDLTAQDEASCEAGSPSAPQPLWQFEAGGAIRSSPAVATGGTHDVVVFGADDGCIYAVPDGAPTAADSPPALWVTCPPSAGPIGTSSPAIDFGGNVYVGSEGGRFFALRPE